jgi:hypothetical protein
MKTAGETIHDVSAEHNIGAWPVAYEKIRKLLDDLIDAVIYRDKEHADSLAALQRERDEAVALLRDWENVSNLDELVRWRGRRDALLTRAAHTGALK